MIRYEFAPIQLYPDANTGDRITVGLALWAPTHRQFVVWLSSKSKRAAGLHSDFSRDRYTGLKLHVEARARLVMKDLGLHDLDTIFEHDATSHLAGLGLEELVGRVLSDPAGCLRLGKCMAGLASSIEVRFEQLKEEFVGRHEAVEERVGVNKDEAFRRVQRALHAANVTINENQRVRSRLDSFVFPGAWENGCLQVLDTPSFDLKNPNSITKKGREICGLLGNLSQNPEFPFKYTAVYATPRDVGKFHTRAIDEVRTMISRLPCTRELLPLESVDRLVEMIRQDLDHRS